MVGILLKMKKKFFLNKKFKFKNFLESQNLLIKLEKFQKMKDIIQIYHLVGVMQKLKLLHML